MKQDATRNAAYTVDCEDYVHVVEFNPFESGDSGNLIAYGGNNFVFVGTCTFQEEEADVEGIQYKTLRTFHHGVRVDGIAWSPETRLDSLPPVIKFCTSAADMKIRLFTSDLQDKNEYKVLEGHSDFINGLVFDPREGQEIASVSDDHTCRIWNLEGIQTAHFVLHSPGMSVCWHPEETFKLMVAEKNGTIRFYDLLAQQAILSLESEQMPLMSAHWCLKNTFKVGAVAGNDWLIWDITRSRYFLSIFIYYLPKNQSLLLNDPLTYSCIPGPHCKAKIRLSYKRARVNGLLHNSHGFYRFTLRVTERIMQRRSFIEGVCVSVCVCVCVYVHVRTHSHV
uniref:Nucleoporin Nup37 n=1 Tax=Bos mutus grunniens TaxID=30521 RepID=A0A8B9W0G3_BOSMU